MDAGGEWVADESRVFRSNCKRPSQRSRCNLGGGKSEVSSFERQALRELYSAKTAVQPGQCPFSVPGHWGTLHPIRHVEWCYHGSTWLSTWWRTRRSWNQGSSCYVVVLLASFIWACIGMDSRLGSLPPCQAFQPSSVWLAVTAANSADMGFRRKYQL